MSIQELSSDDLQSYVAQLRTMGTNVQSHGLPFFFAHGFVFFFVWIIFALVQIFSARYYKHKWETNMVVHAASGSLITFATMFWGFWAIKLKGINAAALANVSSPLAQGSGLHDYGAISTALIAVPLIITGFIPYFRRWQADKGATTLMRLRDVHKVSLNVALNVILVPKLHGNHSCSFQHSYWCQKLQLAKKPTCLLLACTGYCVCCAVAYYGNPPLNFH